MTFSRPVNHLPLAATPARGILKESLDRRAPSPFVFNSQTSSASINQQQLLQSWITQQPPLASKQQLLSYNHQSVIGNPLTNQFLPHAMNTFGCQPQSLQPPTSTSCQPTQQYPLHLTTRQPRTFPPPFDIPPAKPRVMFATTRQPDDYYQPKITKNVGKSASIVEPFNFDGDHEHWLD